MSAFIERLQEAGIKDLNDYIRECNDDLLLTGLCPGQAHPEGVQSTVRRKEKTEMRQVPHPDLQPPKMPALERHETTCSKAGCGKPAMFYPVVLVWAKGYPKTSTPIRGEIGLQFCKEHRSGFTLADLPNIAQLAESAAKHFNKAPADPASAEIEWVPMITG